MRLLILFASAEISALLIGYLAFILGISSLWYLIGIQSLSALFIGMLFRLPSWWLPILGLFVPTMLYTLSLEISPSYFLIAFAILWLLFRSNTKERIPLYLTNQTTRDALLELLTQKQGVKFIDLGCGFAGNLSDLAHHRRDGFFFGVESAPLPFLIGWLRLKKLSNTKISFKSLWQEGLAPYDVVYAFLSPEPMPELWLKAKAEMHQGSLLISNSFEIPGVAPDKILTLNDARQTRLFIWKI